jgi:putative transposase
MQSALFPLQYLLASAALWLNRQQQQVIDYLKEENRLLKEKLGDRKLHFSDAERRRLAERAKSLGRRALSQLDTLVTPATLLRRHRTLIAQKWNYVHRRRVGRPRTSDQIAELVLRMVSENPSWGYTRVQGALRNVGYKVSPGTIANLTTYYVLFFFGERCAEVSGSTFRITIMSATIKASTTL